VILDENRKDHEKEGDLDDSLSVYFFIYRFCLWGRFHGPNISWPMTISELHVGLCENQRLSTDVLCIPACQIIFVMNEEKLGYLAIGG
jgi:hypothetical protein